MIYITKTINDIEFIAKKENDSLLWIPFDPDNIDYQAYLKWLSEGNEPIPADEGTV